MSLLEAIFIEMAFTVAVFVNKSIYFAWLPFTLCFMLVIIVSFSHYNYGRLSFAVLIITNLLRSEHLN